MSNLILVGSIFASFHWHLGISAPADHHSCQSFGMQPEGSSCKSTAHPPPLLPPLPKLCRVTRHIFSLRPRFRSKVAAMSSVKVTSCIKWDHQGRWSSDHHQVPLSEPPPPQLHQVQSYMPETRCQLCRG